MLPTNTTPTLARRMLRAGYGGLKLVALVSAPIAVLYGHLAWVEAKSSSPDLAKLLFNSGVALEQEEEHLVIHRAMLAALNRMLPEAERTRLGIERLAEIVERRLEGVREEQHRRKTIAEARPRQASAPARWRINFGPESEASKRSEAIFEQMSPP